MRRCGFVAVLLVSASLAAGCGDDGTPGAVDAGVDAAVDVMASAPARAGTQACDLERRTLQTAADAYAALTGALPTSEDELLGEGLLREPSELFDLDAGGEIVPSPTGPCA